MGADKGFGWHLQAQAFLQSPTKEWAPPTTRKNELKWKCDICDVKTRNEPDWLAHLASKEHTKRVREREQCAVLVLGLPEVVGPQTIKHIFKDHELPLENISFVPAEEPGAANGPQESLGPEAFWHVQLKSVDDARRAVKNPEITIDGRKATVTLAIHPFRCTICNMSLNSNNQLQQHLNGSKHKELLKAHVAQCGLMLAGVPLDATEEHIRQFFAQFEIAEGGILLIDGGGLAPMQTACVTFGSKQDAEQAFRLREGDATLLNTKVRILRRYEAPAKEAPEAPIAGEKTPEEVQLLARSFLYGKKLKEVGAISPNTFGRVFTFYLSSKPPALTGVTPKDRFFDEFDLQAGGKQGTVSLEQALAIIRPLEWDFPFSLPPGVEAWLQEKLHKYCQEDKGQVLSKGTFVQIRNLKCHTFQALQHIVAGMRLNLSDPPVPLQFPYQRRFPQRQGTRSMGSQGSQGSAGRPHAS